MVQKVLRKARKGTRVIYVPGNHDSMARQFLGLAFGDVEVADDVVHTTADGRRLLVTHGDQFDGVLQHARWLAYLGDSGFGLLPLVFATSTHLLNVSIKLKMIDISY